MAHVTDEMKTESNTYQIRAPYNGQFIQFHSHRQFHISLVERARRTAFIVRPEIVNKCNIPSSKTKLVID